MNNAPSFAIGEVEALVLKAYRGAGFSWGMAQEAGKAAGWLTGRRLPALDAFAALLNQTAGLSHEQLSPKITSSAWPGRWVSSSNMLCPVVCGALLSDLGPTIVESESTVTFTSVASPLILVPFVATLGVPAILRGSNIEVGIFDGETEPFPVSGTLAREQDVVLEFASRRLDSDNDKYESAGCGDAKRGDEDRSVRGVADAESIKLLETLAHKTYVPATLESRESGAGAGLKDND